MEPLDRLLKLAMGYEARQRRLPDFGTRYRIVDGIDLAKLQSLVPIEPREDRTCVHNMAVDLKVQAASVLLTLWEIYDREVLSLTPRDTANITAGQLECQRLRSYALDQAMIGCVRVLAERLMNLVYFVVKRERLDVGSSKKRKFQKLLEEHEDLRTLFSETLEAVARLDDAFRTPEFHKMSTLRRTLLDAPESPSSPTDLQGALFDVVIPLMSALRTFQETRAQSNR